MQYKCTEMAWNVHFFNLQSVSFLKNGLLQCNTNVLKWHEMYTSFNLQPVSFLKNGQLVKKSSPFSLQDQ